MGLVIGSLLCRRYLTSQNKTPSFFGAVSTLCRRGCSYLLRHASSVQRSDSQHIELSCRLGSSRNLELLHERESLDHFDIGVGHVSSEHRSRSRDTSDLGDRLSFPATRWTHSGKALRLEHSWRGAGFVSHGVFLFADSGKHEKFPDFYLPESRSIGFPTGVGPFPTEQHAAPAPISSGSTPTFMHHPFSPGRFHPVSAHLFSGSKSDRLSGGKRRRVYRSRIRDGTYWAISTAALRILPKGIVGSLQRRIRAGHL